jgi:hypothetical protein
VKERYLRRVRKGRPNLTLGRTVERAGEANLEEVVNDIKSEE